MSYHRSDIDRAPPGIDGMLELGLQGIAAAVLIIAAVFWAVTAFSMFVFFGIKNGFAKTTQHVWEATAPPKAHPALARNVRLTNERPTRTD